MYYVDRNLENFERIFDQNSRNGYLRLDLNENPGGLPEDFVKKILGKVTPEFIAKYPETLEFSTVLANFLGTDIEHLCLVNGSSEGIRYIIEAFSSPGGKIVGVAPSYAMFEVYCQMYGRKYIPVEYTNDLQMPIKNILNQLSSDVELLILLNPNNPIGNVYSEDEMKELITAAHDMEITVLIDEAYMYFYSNSFIHYALEEEHIFITRTFSKLFSMAGCRLGYVAGWPEGIKLIQKLCTPHNVNAFGMLFAQAVIEDDELLNNLISKQKQGKQYLVDSLKEHGYEIYAGEGNFIFIKPQTNAKKIVEQMKHEKKILIKMYSRIGKLGDCLRVTTGEEEYMQRFLTAFYELDR